jgi:hypothetical protein
MSLSRPEQLSCAPDRPNRPEAPRGLRKWAASEGRSLGWWPGNRPREWPSAVGEGGGWAGRAGRIQMRSRPKEHIAPQPTDQSSARGSLSGEGANNGTAGGPAMARRVERSLVDAAAGKNFAFKEALLRKLELLRAELAGPDSSPVEKALADRAATCWLYLHDLEVRFVQAKELTINQADYQQRALDRAHKRYLTALKALAQVRRLALPALQVNIAHKQVNKAG